MILTDREIQAAIKTGQIVINPLPGPEKYSSTSLDLTLLNQVRVWRTPIAKGVNQEINPAEEGYKYSELAKEFTVHTPIGPAGYVLEPRAFVLAWTVEEIELPSCARLAARVEGKSSIARLGIGVHVTAPTIHAGFKGPIQLEMCNHGPLRVKLSAGMPICQLIFEQTLGTPEKGYTGQFKGQAAM